MRLSIRSLDEIVIVTVTGAVESNASGYLFDVFVECLRDGRHTLIVDLSGVHLLTHAGVRGLVVAAKMLQQVGGALRICGAQPAVRSFLSDLGFDHLLHCDPTLEVSLARLRNGETQDAETSATILPFGAPMTYPFADARPARRTGS